ncbi:MAG: alpha/beta hydrolase [Eubacteriales bacterium]|nr:alpha/beta hydrolase [Eubacteriales bacterium]
MPSVISTLMKAQIALLNPLINTLDLETQRRVQDGLGALGARVRAGQTVSCLEDLGTCQAAWAFPLQGTVHKAILYLHGGGYTAGTLEYAQAFGSMLALEAGQAALCLVYRLAPENPFPAALEDALKAYQLLLTRFRAEDTALVGESAGGGLCFALAMQLRDLGLPMPGKLAAISPWGDLSLAPDEDKNERDLVLDRRGLKRLADMYLGGHPARDPYVSPVYGDFTGLPESLLIAGGDEIILPDTRRLARGLQDAGIPCHMHIEEGMWHVYPLYPVPEAREAQRMLRDFLNGGER